MKSLKKNWVKLLKGRSIVKWEKNSYLGEWRQRQWKPSQLFLAAVSLASRLCPAYNGHFVYTCLNISWVVWIYKTYHQGDVFRFKVSRFM